MNKKIVRRMYIGFLVFLIFFLVFSILVYSQTSEQKEQKQLKIFQLSGLLENEGKFTCQEAYYRNASTYYSHEYFSYAIGELDKIEYSNLYLPLYYKSQLLKAKCYEKLNLLDSALYIYNDILSQIPFMEDYTLYFTGNVYLSMDDTRNALELYQRLIKEYPESVLIASAQYQIALIHLKKNKLDTFLEKSQAAIQFSLSSQFKGDILAKVSDVLWEKELFIASLTSLKELLENRYSREQNSHYENLFVKRFQLVKENKNVEMIPELSIFCAGVLFNYRQYRMAELLYKELIDLYPEQINLAQVYYNMARTIHYQGEYDRVIEYCEYILDNFLDEDIIVRTLYLYAGALLSSGNRDKAIIKYQEIIERFPESYFARSSYLELSEIEFLKGNEHTGLSLLNQLISDYPQTSQARESGWRLARYYTKHNLTQKAIDYYKLVYERFNNSNQADDALFWLAKLEYSVSPQKGNERYKTLLKEFPDSYYSFRVPQNIRNDIVNIENIIDAGRENSVEILKNKYPPENIKSQLSVYKMELLKDLDYYNESIWENLYALEIEPGNNYLLYLLVENYFQANKFYLSIGQAQNLLNYFLENDLSNEIPFQIWKYSFPVHFSSIIKKLANKYQLDSFLIWATIREESHFNRYSESRAGAIGLMQIMLSTGEWIAPKLDYQKFEYDLLLDPEVNIQFGCWYLNYLKEKFNENYHLIISGYNAGPGITERWIQEIGLDDIDYFVENIPYAETTEHIKKVMRAYLIYKIIYKENI